MVELVGFVKSLGGGRLPSPARRIEGAWAASLEGGKNTGIALSGEAQPGNHNARVCRNLNVRVGRDRKIQLGVVPVTMVIRSDPLV